MLPFRVQPFSRTLANDVNGPARAIDISPAPIRRRHPRGRSWWSCTERHGEREMGNEIAGPRDSADQNKTFRTAAVARTRAPPPPPLPSLLLLLSSSPDIWGLSRDSARSGTLIRVVGAKYHVESTTNERTNERTNVHTYERMNQRTNRHQRLLLSVSLSHVVIVSLSAIFLFGTLSPSDSTPLLRLSLLLCVPSLLVFLSAR